MPLFKDITPILAHGYSTQAVWQLQLQADMFRACLLYRRLHTQLQVLGVSAQSRGALTWCYCLLLVNGIPGKSVEGVSKSVLSRLNASWLSDT